MPLVSGGPNLDPCIRTRISNSHATENLIYFRYLKEKPGLPLIRAPPGFRVGPGLMRGGRHPAPERLASYWSRKKLSIGRDLYFGCSSRPSQPWACDTRTKRALALRHEAQAKRCGRHRSAPAPQRQNHQGQNRGDKGHGCQQLSGDPQSGRLRMQLQHGRTAKQ